MGWQHPPCALLQCLLGMCCCVQWCHLRMLPDLHLTSPVLRLFLPALLCGGGRLGSGLCQDSGACCSRWGHCGRGYDYCRCAWRLPHVVWLARVNWLVPQMVSPVRPIVLLLCNCLHTGCQRNQAGHTSPSLSTRCWFAPAPLQPGQGPLRCRHVCRSELDAAGAGAARCQRQHICGP